MRWTWIISWIAVLWGLASAGAWGQDIPATPALPGAAATAVPAAATAAAPTTAQPANLWTFLCPPPQCTQKCKDRLCASMFGQLLGSALTPMRMMTGGLMQPCCPPPGSPTAADLAKDADTPAGAAARIKQDEAGAKARRADVRYLGTVDCNRYPEAEKALIKALRTDRNECVRFEAALALGNGCCCTRATVAALLLTANCSDRDGNPIETSPRVKQAAAHALAHCEAHGGDYTPEPPEKAPEMVPGAGQPLKVQAVSMQTPAKNSLPSGYNGDDGNSRPRGLLQMMTFSSGSNATEAPAQRGLLQNVDAAGDGRGLLQSGSFSANGSNSGGGGRGLFQMMMSTPNANSGYNTAATDSAYVPPDQRGVLQNNSLTTGNIPTGYNVPNTAPAPTANANTGPVPSGERGLFQMFMRRVQPPAGNGQ